MKHSPTPTWRRCRLDRLFLSLICLSLSLSLFLVACADEPAPPTPTRDPQVVLGEAVFRRECAACHAVTPEAVIVGPSLAGIAVSAAERVPGQDAHQYILNSILQPDAYLVDGFENVMPSNLGKKLSSEDLDAVVAYLLTLRTE